jgi:Primase C terminal 2 (PriCT-2)/Family of unknown function (DUF5906)/Bifunctional DNA primase/polymerase, N-terminal
MQRESIPPPDGRPTVNFFEQFAEWAERQDFFDQPEEPSLSDASTSPRTNLRLSLKSTGYSPIPARGKETHLPEWPKKIAATVKEIESWETNKLTADHSNTGLVTAKTPGFDVDISNAEAAEAVEALVREQFGKRGKIIVRTGRAPKRLIPFRCDKPFKVIKQKFVGTDDRIEFLAQGQMFVAFGVHPDTGKPYAWRGTSPGKVKREELPEITAAEAEALVEDATNLLADKFGYARDDAATRRSREEHNPLEPADPAEVEFALTLVSSDDRDTWFKVGCALVNLSRAVPDFDWSGLYDQWSSKCEEKYDEDDVAAKWRDISEHDYSYTFRTIFWLADKADPSWRVRFAANRNDLPSGVSLEDFRAYMPMHNYIFTPSREPWPGSSVNARIPPIPILDAGGKPVLDEDGEPKYLKASTWLDQNRPVEQMTWAPGMPMLIADRLVDKGGWIERLGMTCFNLYRPPMIALGDAAEAGPWLELVRKVYPDDADHIIPYLAQRVQRPEVKINHALFLGGEPGIGKDTLLAPVKRAVGPWNFEEVSPQQVMGRFNAYLKSVILRVSEIRDLGDVNRFQFHERMKTATAEPPDVLRVDEKNLREYSVFNCCAVIYTTNRKDSIYLPADDRRTYAAWSKLKAADFTKEYWDTIWQWYVDGGYGHVAAYLATLDISAFNPKAPPLKTAVFWEIVELNRAPEDDELADAIDNLATKDKDGKPIKDEHGNVIRPDAVTIKNITDKLPGISDFYFWLTNRKNRRAIPHRMEQCGYVSVQNGSRKDGRWVIGTTRHVIYARAELSIRDRHVAAEKLKEKEEKAMGLRK